LGLEYVVNPPQSVDILGAKVPVEVVLHMGEYQVRSTCAAFLGQGTSVQAAKYDFKLQYLKSLGATA
jgi:hypothetical protein